MGRTSRDLSSPNASVRGDEMQSLATSSRGKSYENKHRLHTRQEHWRSTMIKATGPPDCGTGVPPLAVSLLGGGGRKLWGRVQGAFACEEKVPKHKKIDLVICPIYVNMPGYKQVKLFPHRKKEQLPYE